MTYKTFTSETVEARRAAAPEKHPNRQARTGVGIRSTSAPPKRRRVAVTRRCELLDVARSTVYYRPTGISAEDLALMRLLDEDPLSASVLRQSPPSRRARDPGDPGESQASPAPGAPDGPARPVSEAAPWRDGRHSTDQDSHRVWTATTIARARPHDPTGAAGWTATVEEGLGLPSAGPYGERLLPVQVDQNPSTE